MEIPVISVMIVTVYVDFMLFKWLLIEAEFDRFLIFD